MPNLNVNVIDAKDLKDTQLLGKQDPYVEIRSDTQSRRTKVHNNGGINPGIPIRCLYDV